MSFDSLKDLVLVNHEESHFRIVYAQSYCHLKHRLMLVEFYIVNIFCSSGLSRYCYNII